MITLLPRVARHAGYAVEPLHPWLQPYAPSGQNDDPTADRGRHCSIALPAGLRPRHSLLSTQSSPLSPQHSALSPQKDAVASSQERTHVTGSSSASAADDGHFHVRIHLRRTSATPPAGRSHSSMPLADDQEACYTDDRLKRRVLCGSI